jgi:spore coat polysaccharide biosynthesis protein SpsF
MSEKPRVVAIIQARMGSTRLPGKVLRLIAGEPLLWHIVHRLRRAQTIDAIAIATSDHPRDDAIEAFGKAQGIAVIRGPEEDVLARFALAAETMQADVIVRVSSDAPFIDPRFIDHLVRALIADDADYVMMPPGALCAHDGVDPFSRRALKRLVREVPHDPVAREHVTGYFKLHPHFARITYAAAYPQLAHESARLTIDTPDDVAFAEIAYRRLAVRAGEASLSDLLLLLEREPELKAANAHVRQKALGGPQGGLALIRCDGGGALGFGHVKRMLAIARQLRDREGIGVVFALHGEEEAARVLREAGFETVHLPRRGGTAALETLVKSRKPGILICDARENLSRAQLDHLRPHVAVLAVIDDASLRRLAASHAYYPPVPQAHALDWRGAECQVHIGWEWAVLGFDPARYRTNTNAAIRPRLVVTMGGSDPYDLTRLAAHALATITGAFEAHFVIGPGFTAPSALRSEILALHPNFSVIEGAQDLGPLFSQSDLALAAFGVTAYELGALGVPALYIALSEDHARSASAFEQAGMGAVLGLAGQIRKEEIARAVWALMNDAECRADMHAAGLHALDGEGARRIASDLAAVLAAAQSGAQLSLAQA